MLAHGVQYVSVPFHTAPSMPGDFTGDSPDPFTIDVSWTKPQTDGGKGCTHTSFPIPLTSHFFLTPSHSTGRPLNGYHISITDGMSPVMGGRLDKDTFSFRFEGLDQNITYQ